MMNDFLQKITCTFNIFDNGRQYTGKQRGYILDNVKSVLYSNEVREKLRLRELVGYVSHGLREMAGKLTLGETLPVKLPNGQMTVVNALPGCVTTQLDIDDDGNLTHTQEILKNEEGKKILGLHNSRVGGFSWACGGGKVGGNTLIDGFYGFDYVHNPLFVKNRGYVLDSASDEEFNHQMVLDNLSAAGVPKESLHDVIEQFQASSSFETSYYQRMLFDSQQVIADQASKNNELQLLLDSAKETANQHESKKQKREAFFKQLQNNCHVSISNQVLDALISAESESDMKSIVKMIMDVSNLEMSHLPITAHKKIFVRKHDERASEENPYGVNSSLDVGFYS